MTFLPDLLRFTHEGWPKCCGHTMALFVEEPTLAKTAPDPKTTPATLPQEARELLDHAKEKAEQVAAEILHAKEKAEEVAADIEKSKEVLEQSATPPGAHGQQVE